MSAAKIRCICAVPELTHDPLGEVRIQSTRKRLGWVLQPESTHTHRHTNHTHPLPNAEKCNLKVPHVCGKENKAGPPPPSAPFPYFPNSLQPEFPLEEGINGGSLQSFTWETCREGFSSLRASDSPEKPTLAAGNYFIPAIERDLNSSPAMI